MNTNEHDPFRPRYIEDMAGAYDWGRLRGLLTAETPPNVILVGPAGVGKSCALHLILTGRIGLWLRCSQDQTLRDSRDRIKAVARRKATPGQVNWIVLEHADMLHTDAQAFLRRIIETSLGACRFVLEVRDVGAIAEPLVSRAILFNAPQLLPYEIRAEILRRAPGVSVDSANLLSHQCGGNVRWAIIQGLCGGDGYVDMSVFPTCPAPTSWIELLRIMEQVAETGTNPRVLLGDGRTVWERAGGVCPWALTAAALAIGL